MLEATPTTHEAVRGRIQIYFYGLPTLREYLLPAGTPTPAHTARFAQGVLEGGKQSFAPQLNRGAC